MKKIVKESLKDKLRGPSKETAMDKIRNSNLNCVQLLSQVIEHNFFEGIRYVIEERGCDLTWNHIDRYANLNPDVKILKYLFDHYVGPIDKVHFFNAIRGILLNLYYTDDEERIAKLIAAGRFLLDNAPKDIREEIIEDQKGDPIFKEFFEEYT